MKKSVMALALAAMEACAGECNNIGIVNKLERGPDIFAIVGIGFNINKHQVCVAFDPNPALVKDVSPAGGCYDIDKMDKVEFYIHTKKNETLKVLGLDSQSAKNLRREAVLSCLRKNKNGVDV